jgi:hypothetical protein
MIVEDRLEPHRERLQTTFCRLVDLDRSRTYPIASTVHDFELLSSVLYREYIPLCGKFRSMASGIEQVLSKCCVHDRPT